uniref:Uncharacterized protein n=1 Tax=Entomoneis paludosa TaxID=265537 RepID=A0A7S3DXN8_9STRA
MKQICTILKMFALVLSLSGTNAFLPLQTTRSSDIQHPIRQSQPWYLAARYGPVSDDEFVEVPKEDSFAQKKERYRILLDSILAVRDPQHVPSLLAKDMDLLLTMTGNDGSRIAQDIVDETRSQGGDEMASKMEEAIDLTLTFAENFVNQASKIDKHNKELLGKILRTMSAKEPSSRKREESLDDLFSKERDNLTAGFLRHVEGECERIAAAPQMTKESARLLETLRIIQARVVEELGDDLGEAAQVLGQLIGYESSAERLAVLEAGLTVRGMSFARELKELTAEALDGFQRVTAAKPDPELVEIVQEIDRNLLSYLEDNSKFE